MNTDKKNKVPLNPEYLDTAYEQLLNWFNESNNRVRELTSQLNVNTKPAPSPTTERAQDSFVLGLIIPNTSLEMLCSNLGNQYG